MKKTDVAKKMKPTDFLNYGRHVKGEGKSTTYREHIKQKGKASLNPVQKSKDNMVMEGRNEQEKS